MKQKTINDDFRAGFNAGLQYAVDAGWPKDKMDQALRLYDQLQKLLKSGLPANSKDGDLSDDK